jgi:hypothetical protein
METLLIAITLVSLVVAVVMSVVAWRVTHAEKRRAAARVAALVAAVEADPQESPDELSRDVGLSQAPWRSPAPVATEARLAGRGAALEAPALPDAVSVSTGFLGAQSPIQDTQQHQQWLRLAAAVLAVVLGTVVFVRMSQRGATPGAVHAQAAPAPLELLSLRHERQGVNLSVAGLVRNPPAGAVLERVTAVVFLFDQQGTFMTSAKAPIDFLKLTAGDESPFVVKVAAPTSVARYRVSFRTDDGTLAHVDRRGEPPVTAPAALTRSEK